MFKKRRCRLFQTSQLLEDRETPTADPFTLVALPDTQHYTEYASLNFIIHAQTQWIVDHRVDQNIRFVLGLGDIVENASIPGQWTVADAAYDRLDGDLVANPDGLIPYSTPPGNHDYNIDFDRNSGTTFYNQYFGPSRFQGRSWFGGSYLGVNTYSYFSGGGYQFLQIALEYEPTDDDIDWARMVIRNNPGMPTILTTHSYLFDTVPGRKITRASPDGASGETLFRKLVYPNSQIFMVLNGHFDSRSNAPAGGAGEYQQTSYNAAGLPVFEMLSDYQNHDAVSGLSSGSGLMRLLRFDPAAGTIRVQTYSPSQNLYETDANSDFTYQMNFASRFANNAPDPVRVLSFQEGVDFGSGTYTGTQDTQLQQSNATTSFGDSTIDLLVDYPVLTETSQVLLRFDNIFGNGPGQVPLGSRILSATLAVDSNNSGAGGKFHRMVGAWSESSTWGSMGSGIQANGSEARTTYESQAGTSALTPVVVASTPPISFNVTADVKAWSAGEVNHGWAILPWTNGTDGWGFAPSEAVTPTLRPKLRIEWLPATADPNTQTVTFQQGLNGYTGAVDTYLYQGAPTSSFATAPVLYMDVLSNPIPTPPDAFTSLLRFDQLFGMGSNQIRPDAQIEAAYLYLMTPAANDTKAPGGGARLNRMLMTWNATDTWDTFGGDGIQANNIEALSTSDWNTGSVDFGEIRIDVTPSLKLWQTGATNRGWAILPNSDDQWQVVSSDYEAISDRPRLVIVAKNTPPKVESVVINNGAAQRSRVDSITINFSTMVFGPGATPPTASAFELKRSDGLVALAMATVQIVNNKTSVILNNFSGAPTEFSSLADGRWNMRIFSSLTNSDGILLDGNGDGTGGDDYVMIGDPATNKLFRLYGDSDGNNRVDQVDFNAFVNAFNSGSSSIFDFDNSGQIDHTDFLQFRIMFNAPL